MKTNDNNNKVNRKIKQMNMVKSCKKTIQKYVPLSSVTIDIVGQHYKKELKFNIKKEPLHAHSIHSAGKCPAHVAKRFSFSKFFYIIGLVN